MEYEKISFQGKEFEGMVVEIAETTGRFCRVRLEDGTVFKMMTSPTEVTRLKGAWDEKGNPVYLVNHQTSITIIESPKRLKREVF